jgi:outer membrane protein assembly factor BamA
MTTDRSCCWRIFAFVFILLFQNRIVAQVAVENNALLKVPLSKINIEGNEVTKPEIILREMKLKVGMLPDAELLQHDLLRIRGLGLFSRVEFFLNGESTESKLLIRVTEEWYIFPFPYWEFTDDRPPRSIYGFQYKQRNFRGRDETLTGSLWGGADRGFLFQHIDPWMRGTPGISRSIMVYQLTEPIKILSQVNSEFENRQTVADITVGKRWTIDLRSQLGVRFRVIQDDTPKHLATLGLVDQIFEAQAALIWDTRDDRQFTRKGFYTLSRITHGWLFNADQKYTRFTQDLRLFLPYKSVSLCTRSALFQSWGDIPPYDLFTMEDTSPVRSFGILDQGKSMWIGTFEARLEILPLKYFTWNSAPYFKQYFTNLPYGLATEVFWDMGDVYNEQRSFTLQSFKQGYGVGLLVRLPYAKVVRLESSWNPKYSWQDVLFSWRVGLSF